MVNNGTTTACYLLSMHVEACTTLANITCKLTTIGVTVHSKGLAAIICHEGYKL